MKIRAKTKHGRTFWRFGVQLQPDEWTDLDVTPEQLAQLRRESAPLAEGGVIDLEEEPAPRARGPRLDDANTRVSSTPNMAAGKKGE